MVHTCTAPRTVFDLVSSQQNVSYSTIVGYHYLNHQSIFHKNIILNTPFLKTINANINNYF